MNKSPKHIFCATTKMSGAEYLADAFRFDRDFLFDGERSTNISYPLIKNDFDSVFAQFKKNMGVIHFIDNPVYGARRLCEGGSIPGEDPDLIDFSDSKVIIKPEFLKYREFQHDFYKTFWYCLEVYARSKHIISRYRNVKHYVFFSKWLLDPKEIISLMKSFGARISVKNAEFISGLYDEYGVSTSNEIILAPHNAEKMAARFVDAFGDQFLLSKEECGQLLNL